MTNQPQDIANFNGLVYTHVRDAKPDVNYMLWVLPPKKLNMANIASAQVCMKDVDGNWSFLNSQGEMVQGATPDSPVIYVTDYPWQQFKSNEYTIEAATDAAEIAMIKLSVAKCEADSLK